MKDENIIQVGNCLVDMSECKMDGKRYSNDFYKFIAYLLHKNSLLLKNSEKSATL